MAITKTDIENTKKARRIFQLKTGIGSDLTLKCGSKTWPVHSAVLSAQSTFFAKACAAQDKTGVIELKDENPHIVQAMLDFIYTGTYCTNNGMAVTSCSVMSQGQRLLDAVRCLQTNSALYLVAEKYGVKGLKQRVLDEIEVVHGVIRANGGSVEDVEMKS